MAAYEAALKAAGVHYEQYVYEGVNHAFNNDTSAARYDKAAAELAWSRTVEFLKEKRDERKLAFQEQAHAVRGHDSPRAGT